MKFPLSIIFVLLFISFTSGSAGVGFAFSGAGGRFAQHLALMESLVLGLSPSHERIRPSYISGASSGAISAIALNAILQTMDGAAQSNFTWDDYKELVFSLKTSDVYDNSRIGLAKILAYNIFKGYFLDNTPLRTYLKPYFAKMGYKKLGDLYLPTCITLVDQSTGWDHRLWSTDPRYSDLDLLDVIMATTALPMAFPPRKVPGLGNTTWIDGATGVDTVPIFPLLHNSNVSEIYILCYSSALTSGGAVLPYYLGDIPIVYNAMATIDDMRVDLFVAAIELAARASIPSYTYIPVLTQEFSALDFDEEKLEYQLTAKWAANNNPKKINETIMARKRRVRSVKFELERV